MKTFQTRLVLLICALATGLASGYSQAEVVHSDTHEKRLISAIEDIKKLNIDTAIERLEKLVSENPRFKLAQLVYADFLKAKTQALNTFGQPYHTEGEKIDALREEAVARWKHHTQHPQQNHLPRYLLQLNSEQKNIILVDTSQSRLMLYRNKNGAPVLVDDFYASIGKNGVDKLMEGDKRTPLGVYFVSRFLEPESLPDFYGHGAFPINYPNSWDRFRGRTGSGIWLHGNPLSTYSRPPLDSDGCVTVTNNDFDRIKPYISVDQTTPFVIADGVEWVDTDSLQQRRELFTDILMRWKKDWESLDHNRYMSHYSNDFSAEGVDFAQWKQEKLSVNQFKDYIKINLDDISILEYPGNEKVTVITFVQTYVSNNYRGKQRKRIYLKQETDNNWRIFYEGSV
ncbi:MAG: L,D-transpeptidase family protein [Gammaproteobacteria bacterium]|nr:L,D-transpeptidase family protein [Gammaproteobacteria bacterium]